MANRWYIAYDWTKPLCAVCASIPYLYRFQTILDKSDGTNMTQWTAESEFDYNSVRTIPPLPQSMLHPNTL